jgi:pimeloyl-ACP methyl ester carboxylesterase
VGDGLLLLHAWPLDARMWAPQRSALPGAIPIAAPNHPGFGGSELAGRVTTMAACAERALSALDEAGIDRAVVCGLSMGGYVAFELWRRARSRIAGLVLANTRAVADGPEARQARTALAARLRSEGNVLAEEPPPLLAEDAPPALAERVRALIAEQPAEAIAAAALGMAGRPDSTPDLATIDVPTLVVTSTGDRLIAREVASEMAGRIPGARLEVVEGAGHLTSLEATATFDRLLVEHLGACGLA